jgi:hypothetical protein
MVERLSYYVTTTATVAIGVRVSELDTFKYSKETSGFCVDSLLLMENLNEAIFQM